MATQQIKVIYDTVNIIVHAEILKTLPKDHE
jgi:hypothetical protein